MAIGRSRRSSKRRKRIRSKRRQRGLGGNGPGLRVESLEDRRLLAIGPQLIGIQPNNGALLGDNDILNVAPRDLTFQFNDGQIVDAATLADAVTITRSGLDNEFDIASVQTDFNTGGAVIVGFQARTPGPLGNDISLRFGKTDMGGPSAPVIKVEGKTIFVELNSAPNHGTTALELIQSINAHPEASQLVEANPVSGQQNTDIAAPAVTYSPLDMNPANTAAVTSNFNTGLNLQLRFTAVQRGPAANGITIEVTKKDYGGARDPLIEVIDSRTIHIELNTNVGNETTASQLVTAFNANAEATALLTASNPVGDPDTDIATPDITYSPLVLSGANDVEVEPGFLGLGDTAREVVFRFSETLPDDIYRIDFQGVGPAPLRNAQGIAFGDSTDDGVDDGQDFSRLFELDLGAQILGVVPQPINRNTFGVLSQSTSQIEVYFNDDDLNPISATDPAFYQLVFTNDTVRNDDDIIYKPIAVQYSRNTDRAILTFQAPLHQLGTGRGAFRLRIGTDEELASVNDPKAPTAVDLSNAEVGGSFAAAHDLGDLAGSQIVSSAIQPQVYTLDLPGSSDEPGHRDIREQIQTHLLASADYSGGVATLYYNFRDDYGADPEGNVQPNLIKKWPEQMQRAREVFDLYGDLLGVQFVETQTQGFTVATGDLRAVDPAISTGAGAPFAVAGVSLLNDQPTLVMDHQEDWYNGRGASDDPLLVSWFETAVREVGHLLGLGETYELPPGTWTGSEPALAFDNVAEPIYPGDHDIVHGQHLYRTDGKDVDLYKFQITENAGPGRFTAETIAERQADSSLLDSVVALYREQNGQRELIARNDDYFSDDSYLEVDLEPGVYFVGVSAAGNEDYDPEIEDSGFGGTSEGKYDLRLTFRPDADNSIVDVDNELNEDASSTSRATALDGDGDGVPGGVFNYWFRVDSSPIIVDKSATGPGVGTLTSPFKNIDDALAAARAGDVVRIVGNGGADGNLATPEDAAPYEIGFDMFGRELSDGSTLEVPRDVTVMVDRGAVFKLRRARIGVGTSSPSPQVDRSRGAFQVLGTPHLLDIAGNVVRDPYGNILPGSVYFTSYHDEVLGGDSDPANATTPVGGDWGGIVFRNDMDRLAGRFDYEREGIFLNYVNQADIRYGGGTVIVETKPQPIAPIHTTDARPTVTFNTITSSAGAAISANPDSFEESNFHGAEYQAVPFTADYTRVGPDVHGNRLVDNSINGMFVRVRTPAGGEQQRLTVPGRWDDTDVVHVVAENLRIQGSPGGPLQTLVAPDVSLVGADAVQRPIPQTSGVTAQAVAGGTLAAGSYTYRFTFVNAAGQESLPSAPTDAVVVADAEAVQLDGLAVPVAPYDAGTRVYRSTLPDADGNVFYEFVAQIAANVTSLTDNGTTIGGLLDVPTLEPGIYDYKVVFVDADGNEGPASDATSTVLVEEIVPGAVESVELRNLPVAPAPYVARRIYRSIKSEYVLVAELNTTDRTYIDHGAVLGGLLDPPALGLEARLHGRLAVDPGTIVKLNGVGIETSFGAQLIAEGLDGSEVVFTSLADDRYGAGGTFATGERGDVQPGGWTGLYAGHLGSVSLDNAIVAYGGGVSELSSGNFAAFNALEIHQADARVTNTVFANNANGLGGQSTPNRGGRGSNVEGTIFVRGAQPVLVDNILIDNAGPAITINVNALNHELVVDHGRSRGLADVQDQIIDNQGPLIRENRLDRNDINGMVIRGGTLTTEGVWDDTDIVHVLLNETVYVSDLHTYGGLRLESSADESLVVKMRGANAGFTATGRPLDIEDRIGGSVQVVGQPGHPVVLSSVYDCQAAAGFRPDGQPQNDTINGTCTVGGGGAPYADVIVAMDESGSMWGAQQFSIGMVADLDNALVSSGIGSTQVGANRYGLVGFGGDSGFFSGTNHETGHAHPLGSAGELWGTAAQYATAANGLVIDGFDEDGYSAIQYALDNYQFRPNAAKFIILVTDESRSIVDPALDYTSVLTNLNSAGVILQGILALDITDVTGNTALAADANNNAYLEDGLGGYTIAPLGSVQEFWFFDTVIPDYADMVWATGGITGDVYQISAGPPTSTSFSNAMITSIVAQAGSQVAPGDWRSLRLEGGANDRNVDVATEHETGNAVTSGTNDVPDDAQFLGNLAPHEKAGDDVRRLGFEVHGSINRLSDMDVYSFDADAGTEVWLDIDRTTYALDTVVELIDSDGNVLARSDNSLDEMSNPNNVLDPEDRDADSGLTDAEMADDTLLFLPDPTNFRQNLNLAMLMQKSPELEGEDLYTTNPRDAGMRVVLPGPAGTTNTYHVRVSSSEGKSSGVYQLQVRLREADEFPGTTVQMADIRYAVNGLEVTGLPSHSPLTGEAAETLIDTDNDGVVDADDNNTDATADNLGNLLNSDRGALSVAGSIAAANDVDWYTFDIQYDSIEDPNAQTPRHSATVLDIDYADGFARANTNLWVFRDTSTNPQAPQLELVMVGRDSNVPEDRPADPSGSIDDLSRGSVGALDPFIGSIELPAAGSLPGVNGFWPGRYYVAVSSNAQLPQELEQFLTPTAANPAVRLEPINSVNRIAEDHVGDSQGPTTANGPQIPVLFGLDDRVTLYPPDGSGLADGESFTVMNALGNLVTYEFDLDGTVAGGSIPIEYDYTYSPLEVGTAIAEAILGNPPDSPALPDPLDPNPPVPTENSPLVFSTLDVTVGPAGEVSLTESVERWTLLNTVTTTDFFTSSLISTPITRTTNQQVEPEIRQYPAPGGSEVSLYVSRPAAASFELGDVTLFVSQDSSVLTNDPTDPSYWDRTDLLSVDPFTGQPEARIGTFGSDVGDIAMHPDGLGVGGNGGLFAYSTPQFPPTQWTDASTGNYWQINPASATPANLGASLGDDGIVTYMEDPANAGKAIVVGGKAGIGVRFNAMTFNNKDTQASTVQGFAVGNRGDTFVDPDTGDVFSTALGIPNPANILFEFNPDTGAAIGTARAATATLVGGGTQIEERGALDTKVDAFPIGGANSTITGVDATTMVAGAFGSTWFNIEDGDIFEIDTDGNTSTLDFLFEFDSGPELFMDVDTTNATNPQVVLDGDKFLVDGVQFEFDTGSVIVVTATNGSQVNDGGTITITNNATPPESVTFEFDNDATLTSGANTAIPFTNNDSPQLIIASIRNAINGAVDGNGAPFGVTAVQLGSTNRITLLGESITSGVSITGAGSIAKFGVPGVPAASVRIPVEETYLEDEIGQAIMSVIDGTQAPIGVQAGAQGNRLNFMNATSVDFTQVTNPIFTTNWLDPNIVGQTYPTGTAGLNTTATRIPFLASDNAGEIAQRVHAAVVRAVPAQQVGATVFLEERLPQPAFVCNSLGTPPQIGAPGVADCPLQSGGIGPGGSITGMAFVGPQLYAVTDTGGLFRIAEPFAGSVFDPTITTNVADYIDGSREVLAQVNEVTTLVFDAGSGQYIETTERQPIRFAGLTAGPQNAEDGRYENLLFGIDNTGRIFAFDTLGRPQAVFANGRYYADSGVAAANGLDFGILDDNLWHTTLNRNTDAGHGVGSSFDGSRLGEDPALNASFYFGYEGQVAQSQLGTGVFAPATPALTYDFPGGAHGSLVSNPFSMKGYAKADKPTLYFNYFLETEQADAANDTTLVDPDQLMLDTLRVYISGDDGRWKLLSTNNSDRDASNESNLDEFDPFYAPDPVTGALVAEQPFQRSETFDGTGDWRQARVDLSAYAGQDNLRLRFDFATAGGMSSGGRDVILDLNTAGNELRAIPGAELRDGQMFTLTDGATGDLFAGFEIEMGPTIVAPTGAAVDDGDTFDIDGVIYEFDNNNTVGATSGVPHVKIAFDGTETAETLAIGIETAFLQNTPEPIELIGDLTTREPNDTLTLAEPSGLDGRTQIYKGLGIIGDNVLITDSTMDVDMVSFHLDVGDSVTIETNTGDLASQLDTYLRLFDADGNELADNDDVDPTNPFSRDSIIEFTAAKRGTYYVGLTANHNQEYPTDAPASAVVPGATVTSGFYELVIRVTDPTGPKRVGNRLNLPNVNVITASGLPASFVDGTAGVRASISDPANPSTALPVYPVRVHAGMTNLSVADAVQIALADSLGEGNVEAFKTRNEVVQLVGYGVGNAGPLGLSGPSDPTTAIENSGLFGDRFGAFNASADVIGQTGTGFPGAVGMRNNQFEGAYIDDVTVGFASRGEIVTGAGAQTAFTANTAQPADEINVGPYQLEVRQATQYGLSADESVSPSILLYDGFDVNDRLAEGTSLRLGGGHLFADGQTFSISDGQQTVVFEFDDLTVADGLTEPTHVAIAFDPGDSDVDMARLVREAINSSEVQNLLDVSAASADGTVVGTASTSNRINIFGEVSVIVDLVGNGPTGNLPVAEGNDTITTAVETGIVPGGRQGYHATGIIGDNPDVDPFGADVDVYKVELDQGELITIDIDATELDSPLDSVLRVFDEDGNVVTAAATVGATQTIVPLLSDDDRAPGEENPPLAEMAYPGQVLPDRTANRDSYLAFTAPADGAYYIGVSAFDNDQYDPTVEGSGRPGTPGVYEINIGRPNAPSGLGVIEYRDRGDSNVARDQGQLILHSNRITNGSGFGILVNADTGTDLAAPRNLSRINTSRLAPGIVITNNVIAGNAAGGIDLHGDGGGTNLQPAVMPFARIINNTIVGTTAVGGAPSGGVGIRVSQNASPTLLNNVLSGLDTGIELGPTATTTVIGGSLYHNNTAPTSGVATEDFAIVADPAAELFVNPTAGNFYPAEKSPIIDTALDSLEDRDEMIQLREPLGIARSPILAPVYDASGQVRVDDPQVRVDDPNVVPQPGLGETVFRDRGAQDRADFEGPTSKLIGPLDNGPDDREPGLTAVNLLGTSLNQFSIQLIDGQGSRQGSLDGIGVDDSTVGKSTITITQDNRTLVEGTDYTFDYNSTSHIIRLTPLAGIWDVESTYVIHVSAEDRFVIVGQSGDKIVDGTAFSIADENGDSTTFEYDSGYVIEVPQTLALQIPVEGGGVGGVEDGDTITVDNSVTTTTVTLELDSDGLTLNGNVPVPFDGVSSQGEVADAIVAALTTANVGLNPVNVGGGYVHLGVNGDQTLNVVSNTIRQEGVAVGVADGETFTVDDGTTLVTFEFDNDASITSGNVPVDFLLSQTYEQIAESISNAINNGDPSVVNSGNQGLNTQHLGNGRIHIGGELNHIVDVSLANLTLTGQPGARLPWGFRIPTVAGSFAGLITDGETFTIDDGAGTAVTFEFDNDANYTAGFRPVPFVDTDATMVLANTLVARIRDAGLGLFPVNQGNGIVTLGGDANYTLNVASTALTEVGQPGLAGAVAIPYVPDQSFTAEQMVNAIVQVINNEGLPGVTAVSQGTTADVFGASDASGPFVSFTGSIKDLAGNPLLANQVDGNTRFTIFVGSGIDYGDAPSPYPTLRSQDGARHQIVEGFSLGARVEVNADGLPSPGADADVDEDGVTVDPNTPLLPGRDFNLTVSTSGIGTVEQFGVLDAWIDYNADGDWDDSGEQIIRDKILSPINLTNGEITFSLQVPATAVVGDTYARFRLSTTGRLTPSGESSAGEVEDYLFTISANPWQNPFNRFDVNGSGDVSPVDVLVLVNMLNLRGAPAAPLEPPLSSDLDPDGNGLVDELPPQRTFGRPFLDPSGDGRLSPQDVLEVILELNQRNQQQGEGEGGGLTPLLVAADAEGEAPGASRVVAMPSAEVIVPPLDSNSRAVVVAPFEVSGPLAESTAQSRVDDSRQAAEPSLAISDPLRREPAEPNHLTEILGPDESWLDFVEDVDLAMQDADARDTIFADLGV